MRFLSHSLGFVLIVTLVAMSFAVRGESVTITEAEELATRAGDGGQEPNVNPKVHTHTPLSWGVTPSSFYRDVSLTSPSSSDSGSTRATSPAPANSQESIGSSTGPKLPALPRRRSKTSSSGTTTGSTAATSVQASTSTVSRPRPRFLRSSRYNPKTRIVPSSSSSSPSSGSSSSSDSSSAFTVEAPRGSSNRRKRKGGKVLERMKSVVSGRGKGSGKKGKQ